MKCFLKFYETALLCKIPLLVHAISLKAEKIMQPPCMQDTFARVTHSAGKAKRDDSVTGIQAAARPSARATIGFLYTKTALKRHAKLDIN